MIYISVEVIDRFGEKINKTPPLLQFHTAKGVLFCKQIKSNVHF